MPETCGDLRCTECYDDACEVVPAAFVEAVRGLVEAANDQVEERMGYWGCDDEEEMRNDPEAQALRDALAHPALAKVRGK